MSSLGRSLRRCPTRPCCLLWRCRSCQGLWSSMSRLHPLTGSGEKANTVPICGKATWICSFQSHRLRLRRRVEMRESSGGCQWSLTAADWMQFRVKNLIDEGFSLHLSELRSDAREKKTLANLPCFIQIASIKGLPGIHKHLTLLYFHNFNLLLHWNSVLI